jgi:hypothetical protein
MAWWLFAATPFVLGASFHSPPKARSVTFANDIYPLIERKCVSCHRPGGSAPFSLQTYQQVRRRGDLVGTMVLTRSMPPCYGKSDFVEFCEGGGHFSDEEAVLLQDWLRQGKPEGPERAYDQSPAPEWRLGRPDAVVRPLKPGQVDTEGRPYWTVYVIPLDKLKGRRLRAFDVRPLTPLAVRGATLGLARDGLAEVPRGVTGYRTGGFMERDAARLLGTWAPGYRAWQLPRGVSMALNRDALVLQVLYQPRGKPEDAQVEVGLYFSTNRSDREPSWLTLEREDFTVPAPGNLIVTESASLKPGTKVLGVIPEARFYCSSISLAANGRELYHSVRWMPYWPGSFSFAEPAAFPEGAKLDAQWMFDNDIHMGQNEGTRPRPIRSGPRERDEAARIHVLTLAPD